MYIYRDWGGKEVKGCVVRVNDGMSPWIQQMSAESGKPYQLIKYSGSDSIPLSQPIVSTTAKWEQVLCNLWVELF